MACAPSASLGTAHFLATPVSDAPKGTLLIVGGGSQPPELVRHFVDLAGGPGKARIAILPMATSDAVATGAEKKAELDSLGADSFVVNVTRAQADDDSVVRTAVDSERDLVSGRRSVASGCGASRISGASRDSRSL